MEHRMQPTRPRNLIPIASLLLLAISWVPVAVCTAMPACPMTAAATMGMDDMSGCHPGPAPEGDSCDLSRITEEPCCGITSEPAPPLVREVSAPISTPLPVAMAAPVSVVLTVATVGSVPHRTPAPKTFGRDLLSQHQAFLL